MGKFAPHADRSIGLRARHSVRAVGREPPTALGTKGSQVGRANSIGSPRRRAPRVELFFLAAICLLANSLQPARAELPVSGVYVPQLAAFDQTMLNFMESKGIESGLLAIMKGGQVVYHRGFGWQDRDHTTPLPPDAMMRLASVSKPITAAAVRRLVSAGEVGLNEKAIDIGQPGGGIIQLDPFPSLGDPRLGDITVRNLLQHRGGWDRDESIDLTWVDPYTMWTMGLDHPPTAEEKLQFIMGFPLQHDPGSTYAYSNEGYMMLGKVIESVTGQEYIDVVRERVFNPIGVPSREYEVGRTLVENRNPREPWYQSSSNELVPNLFDPNGEMVARPDGFWNHEAREGNGNLIASTKAILEFLDTYQVSGDNIGIVKSGNGSTLSHTGAQDGVETLARQRSNGIHYVVMFNERDENGSYANQIRALLDPLTTSSSISWPGALVEPGDGDGDKWLTTGDISAFIDALQLPNEAEFLSLYPHGQYRMFDFNDDGLVNQADVRGFYDYMRWSGFSVAELSAVPIPEPASIVLAACGLLGIVRLARPFRASR